ncbi:MAG: DUF4349 domain-containing protein [Spirochaetales bacterium]|nr:DUF4349 domain-containing protein [Spirochaetales bacterium]
MILKKISYVLVITLFLTITTLTFPADDYLHQQLQATLLVAEPDIVAEKITGWAEQAGGYFLVKSSTRVIIRFPSQKMDELRDFLKSIAEDVVTLTSKATDLRENFLEIQSGIASREEMLRSTLVFLDRADIKGTLAIEKEVITLLKEVEELKGKLRKIYVDRLYALATINLNYFQQSIPQDIPSSFDWINSIDFYKFIQEGF